MGPLDLFFLLYVALLLVLQIKYILQALRRMQQMFMNIRRAQPLDQAKGANLVSHQPIRSLQEVQKQDLKARAFICCCVTPALVCNSILPSYVTMNPTS